MFKYHLFYLLICAFSILPLSAKSSVIITLENVGDRIRSQNPDLAAARLRIEEATGRMNQAGRLSNPDLETTFDSNSRFKEGKFEIGLTQRFPLTDRLRLEKEISQSELQSAEAEIRDVERRIITSARNVVIQMMATRQRKELMKEQADLSKKFSDFLSEIAAKGEGSALDAGQAKLAATSLTMEIRQLDATEVSLSGELKPLLGMSPGDSLRVSGSLPQPNIPDHSAIASRRPDYQMAKLEAKAASDNVALEHAKRYDDVEGGIFASAERTEDAPVGYENEGMIGLRFKITLPFWNKNEGAIQEAQAKKERKKLEVFALSRDILLAADSARAEMKEWADMIREINEVLLPLAHEQSTLAETTFRNGQGEIQSVLRSREKRIELAGARLDALREFHLACVRYESALGYPSK